MEQAAVFVLAASGTNEFRDSSLSTEKRVDHLIGLQKSAFVELGTHLGDREFQAGSAV
jgi:hypothetical protein